MRFLNWFRGNRKSNSISANRPRTFRPQLEQLDERLVPSTLTSSAISFRVSNGWFNFTERDWYTVDRTNGQVVEFTGTHRYNLGGAHVLAASASLDPTTSYTSSEVFVLNEAYANAYYGPLSLHNANGWHYLGGSYANISATRDGHVYAVDVSDSSVRYIDSNGVNINLGAPNGVAGNPYAHTIAASKGFGDQNEVFALGADGAIYVNSSNPPGQQWWLVDNQRSYSNLSATMNNTVFALTAIAQYMSVYQETGGLVWSSKAISSTYESCWDFSADTNANGQDEVYVIDPYATAYVYNPAINGGMQTYVDSNVADIAGADDGYFYDVNYNSGNYDAYLWNPNTHYWYYLGSQLS